jgi:hypothetical protein
MPEAIELSRAIGFIGAVVELPSFTANSQATSPSVVTVVLANVQAERSDHPRYKVDNPLDWFRRKPCLASRLG